MAIVAFDVNQTLLSLDPVEAALAAVMGEPAPTAEWFVRLLHLSLVVDHLDRHEPFDVVARRALARVAADRGRRLDDAAVDDVVGTLRRLPAHDDVAPGLTALGSGGHRLVAFSNSSTPALHAQLDHAGILDQFDEVVSVDGGGHFKPRARAYDHLCRTLDAFPDEVTMVASHDWDVAGARHAGLAGVFLARRADTWHLPDPQGTTVSTVGGVADVVGR